MKPSRQQHPMPCSRRAFGEAPVEDLATAGLGSVDHHDVGSEVGQATESGMSSRKGFDHDRDERAHVPGLLRRLIAVELGSPEPGSLCEFDDPTRKLVPEDPDGQRLRWEPANDLTRPVGRNLSSGAVDEIEPQRIGSEGDSEQRIFLGRHTTDLHEHPDDATRSQPSWDRRSSATPEVSRGREAGVSPMRDRCFSPMSHRPTRRDSRLWPALQRRSHLAHRTRQL